MRQMTILLACMLPATLQAQTTHEKLLTSIEVNNLELKAERELMDARVAEARSTNNLPDPSVSFDYLWANPRAAGNSGELNVVQGFDFPSVYGSRSRHIKALSRQYVSEYAALRQQILFEAQSAAIDLSFIMARGVILSELVENARRLSELYARKMEAGQATILDKNKIDIELMNAVNDRNANDIDRETVISRLEILNGGASLDFMRNRAPEPLPDLPSLDEVISVYMNGDARLSAIRTGTEAAGRQVRVARNEALPSFEVGYRREYALGENFDGIKLGMTIPLFESRNTVKRAAAEHQAAQTRLRSVMSETEVTLRQLHAKAALLRESYDSRKMVMEPEQNMKLIDKALESGEITVENYFIEVASIGLLREAQLQIEREYRLAIAELMMPGL